MKLGPFQVLEKMERETGLEPANSLWSNKIRPQTGDEKGHIEGAADDRGR